MLLKSMILKAPFLPDINGKNTVLDLFIFLDLAMCINSILFTNCQTQS